MHMYNVAQCLLNRGHKVIVLTSTYSDGRMGVRYLTNGLKVYYIPTQFMVSQTSLPDCFFMRLPVWRSIFVRERI